MILPKPFLKQRFAVENKHSRLSCICPGFELKHWRLKLLAGHLTEWLPDFAIRHDDLPPEIRSTTDYRLLTEQAAARIYDTKKTENRGEIGELLLHAVCRQFSGTFPTVSKVYYKTSSNDFVKGFDLVHTSFEEKSRELRLWLGEAKFYSNGNHAVRDALRSINSHLDAGFLRSEKILLGGKISKDTPGYSKLEWLFDRDTPLDEIFNRMIVPVLIAYNSNSTQKYENDTSYDESLNIEFSKFQDMFAALTKEISVYCFYFPMKSKSDLVSEFDKKLAAYI